MQALPVLTDYTSDRITLLTAFCCRKETELLKLDYHRNLGSRKMNLHQTDSYGA
jgi:hypothetical protein